MSCAVTFWLPELLNPQRRHETGTQFNRKRFPLLHELLRKADSYPPRTVKADESARDFYTSACELMHQPKPLPVAAVSASLRLADFDAEYFWLKVDPVQLIADRDTLVLIPGEALHIQEHEARELIAAFNNHFEQDRVVLEYGTPCEWFIRIKQPIDIHTQSLDSVSYQSVQEYTPTGHAARYWRQLLNEASMLFFDHAINQARRNRGQNEINGLWLWGEGQLSKDAIRPRPDAAVWSENSYLQGLSKLCQAAINDFPQSYQAWSNHPLHTTATHHLLMPQIRNASLQNGSLEQWLKTLEWLETQWLDPLRQALKNGQIHSLLLELGDGPRYHLQPSHLKRFWRIKNRL
jgi:hypothetical protein